MLAPENYRVNICLTGCGGSIAAAERIMAAGAAVLDAGVSQQPDDRVPPAAPMFNPYGRWRLVPLDGERN